MFPRFLAIALGLLIIGACAPRAVVRIDAGADTPGQVHRLFVGTTRAPDPNKFFGSERSGDLRFAHFDVSVPPVHEVGKIELPYRQPDPAKHFFATGGVAYADGAGFQAALRQALRHHPRNQRVVAVYVHGFNNNFADGVYRLAQMSQDIGLPEVAVHYSWPSAGNPLGYGYDRDSMLFARDGLEELLSLIDGAGAEGILLIGHSMGALLTMETLRQMEIARPGSTRRQLSGVVLVSPDIDTDLFRAQAERIGRLPQPFAIFASQRDRALRLSARLTGQTDRLGTLTQAETLSDLEITIFDVTEFSDGVGGHFSAATSPALIRILRLLPGIEAAFTNDQSGRPGLLPGTILTVQNATQIVLSPIVPEIR